jgi:hypothetical protein
MKGWIIWASLGVLGVLVLISIISGTFGGWTFFGILFYIALYIGGYAYVRIGMQNRDAENDSSLQRRLKFDWCWERINQILKSMPGGQGIEWASGVGRKSWIKSYFDGVQNKPFRSVLAHLEYTQQLVMIIFDIEGDDIAEFITNPSPELMDNPFLYFKPFARGTERDSGLDRFGGYNSSRRYPYSHSRYSHRGSSGGGGLSVNIEPQLGFGEPTVNQEKLNPNKDIVDSAIDRLRK